MSRIGLDGGVNVYAYCGGNPIMCADPSGFQMSQDFSRSMNDYIGYHGNTELFTQQVMAVSKNLIRHAPHYGFTESVFVDDWYLYLILTGEVHCGSYAQRAAFPFPWWTELP